MDLFTEHEQRLALLPADFVMYQFKVNPCPHPDDHPPEVCIYAHPKDPHRRRYPSHSPKFCPSMRSKTWCPYGDACMLAHTLYEQRLHPDRYRIERCSNGSRQQCKNVLCFFAHSDAELRSPPGPPGNAAASQLAQQQQQQRVGFFHPPALQAQPQQQVVLLEGSSGAGMPLPAVPLSAGMMAAPEVLMLDPATGLVIPQTFSGGAAMQQQQQEAGGAVLLPSQLQGRSPAGQPAYVYALPAASGPGGAMVQVAAPAGVQLASGGAGGAAAFAPVGVEWAPTAQPQYPRGGQLPGAAPPASAAGSLVLDVGTLAPELQGMVLGTPQGPADAGPAAGPALMLVPAAGQSAAGGAPGGGTGAAGGAAAGWPPPGSSAALQQGPTHACDSTTPSSAPQGAAGSGKAQGPGPGAAGAVGLVVGGGALPGTPPSSSSGPGLLAVGLQQQLLLPRVGPEGGGASRVHSLSSLLLSSFTTDEVRQLVALLNDALAGGGHTG